MVKTERGNTVAPLKFAIISIQLHKQTSCTRLVVEDNLYLHLGESGIIYTTTIKEVETLTQELRMRGIKAGSYHAQMEPPSRR
jgi:superfamily II DNA helicase RecQ